MTLLHWKRYAALGDAGPWATRLAAILQGNATLRDSGFEYAALGLVSQRVRDVVDDQVPRAISMGADLVSILIGPDDLALPDADPEALADELERGIATLRANGCDVLLATCIEPRFAVLLTPLRYRAAEFNAHLWSIARTHGTVTLDLWGARDLQAKAMWNDDLGELTDAGNRLLATRAAHALGVPYFESRGQSTAVDFGDGFPR